MLLNLCMILAASGMVLLLSRGAAMMAGEEGQPVVGEHEISPGVVKDD